MMRIARAQAIWGEAARIMALVWLAALALTGCQGARTDHGKQLRLADYLITARLVPDPPTVGDNRLILEIKDPRGTPIEGANLEFQVSMPAMGTMA